MVSFVYLHGLLSSSKSKKAIYLKKTLSTYGNYYIPDLYPQKWEFEQMTVSYLLKKIGTWVEWPSEEVILIGSSFGGLLATRFVQTHHIRNKIKALILLAPAFNFYNILKERNSWQKWKKQRFVLVDHPSWQNPSKWSWTFVQDLENNHNKLDEPINVPALLIHGQDDDVIPIINSSEFTKRQEAIGNKIQLISLPNCDHQFSKKLKELDKLITNFLTKENLIE